MSYEFDKYTNKQYKKIEEFFPHKNPKTIIEWEEIAHELAWGIQMLEEEPTRIKSWNRIFNILKRYEELCKRHA